MNSDIPIIVKKVFEKDDNDSLKDAITIILEIYNKNKNDRVFLLLDNFKALTGLALHLGKVSEAIYKSERCSDGLDNAILELTKLASASLLILEIFFKRRDNKISRS